MSVFNFCSKIVSSANKKVFLHNFCNIRNKHKLVFQVFYSSGFIYKINRFCLHKKNYICNTNKYFSKKYSISNNAGNNVESTQIQKSPFMETMHFRKKQALCSVLLDVPDASIIPQTTEACLHFGAIKNIFSYAGISNNVFLLVEYENEQSVCNFLQKCSFRNIDDKFTAYSRILQYEPKSRRTPNSSITETIKEDAPRIADSKEQSVSELIENLFETEKVSELGVRLKFFLCAHLKDSISGLFPLCDILPFGSSVNGLGRKGCDLDCMIRLYPDQVCKDSEFFFFNKTCVGDSKVLQQKTILALSDYFRTFLPGFASTKTILHARVPILKFNHLLLKLDCDVSINNMSAILMTEMLYFCGEIDPRVRPLTYAVKKWAKEATVTYHIPGPRITNFGLSLLVMFFLQNRPQPILPPLNDVLEILGAEADPDFRLNFLVPISELQAKASENQETLAVLLKEFLVFLGENPFKSKHFSILTGAATEKITDDCILVQYPLEENKNVTKNVTECELWEMCEKADFSSKVLSSKLHLKGNSIKDLLSFLGILDIKKVSGQKTKINTLALDEQIKNSKRKNSKKQIAWM